MATLGSEATYDAFDELLPGAVARDVRVRPRGLGDPYDVRVRGHRLRVVHRPSSLWVPVWQLKARLEPIGGGVRVVGRFGQPWTWALVVMLGVPAALMVALAGLALLGDDEDGVGLGLTGAALAAMTWFVWPDRRPCSQTEYDALIEQLSQTLAGRDTS